MTGPMAAPKTPQAFSTRPMMEPELGSEAIISATNDKIQNYLENVDKTFVYANPNKRHISIQEFEKTEFGELAEEE